ncbi:histone acetyltransferase type B catalytic subunit [Histoplasma capsulatum var. duboisii H88]|uniref:Histone acetyltransferase type B catalytic subunit n=1 Tax=Ajellomyces capsulatus (strain H88) TaxID=544711 RepID=A0A8A1LSQ9_AJEC8|nr:histone acetyltransferase type B catalytic subunit [Histoplasma capsulatum var. duboisii H88]
MRIRKVRIRIVVKREWKVEWGMGMRRRRKFEELPMYGAFSSFLEFVLFSFPKFTFFFLSHVFLSNVLMSEQFIGEWKEFISSSFLLCFNFPFYFALVMLANAMYRRCASVLVPSIAEIKTKPQHLVLVIGAGFSQNFLPSCA